jgi:RNA polymerase sigma factor for flagellar operon FliA
MFATVRKLATRLARRLPRHVEVDDLVGAGSLGLVDACRRRGAMTGSEFEAFAAYRIRGAMLDELRRLDAVPRRCRRRANDMAKAHRVVEQRTGAPANEEAVAAEMGLDLPSFQRLRAKIDASHAPISLGGTGGEDEDSLADVADPRAEGPDALAARAQMSERVLEGIAQLSERMRFVLACLYFENKTLREVGLALGVTESRACQIHGEALASLRALLGEREEGAAAWQAR